MMGRVDSADWEDGNESIGNGCTAGSKERLQQLLANDGGLETTVIGTRCYREVGA